MTRLGLSSAIGWMVIATVGLAAQGKPARARDLSGPTMKSEMRAKLTDAQLLLGAVVTRDFRTIDQVAFAADRLARILPWLMLNRRGLVVLVHPETGDAWADHARHAAWLGAVLPLDLDSLRR